MSEFPAQPASALRLAQLRRHPCLILLVAMVALLLVMAFLGETTYGRVIVNLANAVVLVSAAAAVGRSRRALLVAAVLAVPTLAFQFLALYAGKPVYFVLNWGFAAIFYAYVIIHLLDYVLRRGEFAADKLYGAVAAYLMLAILWALLYGVVEYCYPGAFALGGTPKALDFGEMIYFSFTVLTTTGFGDITPILIQSRFLAILEEVTGIMYVAILIARLTSIYPIEEKQP